MAIGDCVGGQTAAFASLASLASSACNTWFPVLPLACGLILSGLAGHVVGQGLLTVPVVAVAMGIEAASFDHLLVRIFMKRSVKRRFMWVLVANLLSASIALALGFAWVAYHPMKMIATAAGGTP